MASAVIQFTGEVREHTRQPRSAPRAREAVKAGAALDFNAAFARHQMAKGMAAIQGADAFDFAADMLAAMTAVLTPEQRKVFYEHARLAVRPEHPAAYRKAVLRMARFG